MPSGLFPTTLDTRVAETATEVGADTAPLLRRYGPDVTWRTVFAASRNELLSIPGYGPAAVDALTAFISENCEYSFGDYLRSLPND